MSEQEFILDIIVNKLEFENEIQVKNENILIKITFDEITLDITSSQINVSEFREGRSIEFKCNIDILKDKLTNNPLQLQIMDKEDENKNIGDVTCEWPFQLVDKLSCKDFSSHAQIVEGHIIKDESKIGGITMAIKLYCKCTEDNQTLSGENLDITSLVDDTGKLSGFNEVQKLVDSNDAFFVIGDSVDKHYTNALNFCADKSCPLKLDTSRYRSVTGRLVNDSAIINPCRSFDCSANKVQSNRTKDICKDILKSLDIKEDQPNRKKRHSCNHDLKGNKPNRKKRQERHPCESIFGDNSSEEDVHKENDSLQCDAEIHSIDCPARNRARKNPDRRAKGLVSSKDSSWDSIHTNYKQNELCNRNTFTQASEITHDTEQVQLRCCAMCNADVSWLPKCSYCPKCGYKNVPSQKCIQTGHNGNLKADDVLKEWEIGQGELGGSQEVKKNRCTCTAEKVCAHCRIKILCGNLLRSFTSKSSKEFCSRKKTVSPLDINSVPPSRSKRIFKKRPKNRKHNDRPVKTKLTRRRSGRKKANTKNKKRTKRQLAKYMKKKFGRRYTYSRGKQYPGLVVGHKKCLCACPLVPPNMGWLWNINLDESRRGWRPGAVRKPIKSLMSHFLKVYPVDNLPVSSRDNGRNIYTALNENHIGMMPEEKPTLHVRKTRGEYSITMNPLKDEKSLRESANPYLKAKPIQFKICKNPTEIQKMEIKKFLKKMGFKKCTCKMPISCCYCRSFMEKERMEKHVTKICEFLKIKNLNEDICFTDTSESESELDIDFTPPAGLVKPSLRRKPNYACKETQYEENDFLLKKCGHSKPRGKYSKPIPENKLRKKSFGKDKENNVKSNEGAGRIDSKNLAKTNKENDEPKSNRTSMGKQAGAKITFK